MTERIREVDLLKGIGIIYVILGHLSPCIEIEKHIYSFHMFLFMFLAGVVINETTLNVKRIIVRIKRLIFPYFGWSLLAAGISLILQEYTLKEAVISILYLDGKPTWNVPVWFLVVIFETEIVFRIIAKKKLLIYVSIIINLILAYVLQERLCVFGLTIVPTALVFYALGYLSRSIFPKLKYFHSRAIMCMAAIALLTNLLLGIYVNDRISVVNNHYGNYFLAILIGILGIWGYWCLAILLKKCDILEYFGKRTMPILCSQYFLFRFYDYLSNKLYGGSIWHYRGSVKAIILTLSTLVVYFCIFQLCKQISLKVRTIFQHHDSKLVGSYYIKLVVNGGEAVAYKGAFRKMEVGRIAITPIFEEDCCKIQCFRVREKLRKNGIGKRLLEKMIQQVEDADFKSLVVYPNSEPYDGDSYVEPQQLYMIYKNLGFEFVDERVTMSKPSNKMIMKLKD